MRRRAPKRIGRVHLLNQPADIAAEWGPARAPGPRLPAPGEGEHLPVPAHDGIGRYDVNRPAPIGPDAGERDPQESIDRAEPGSVRRLALEDGELVAEGQDFRLEGETRADGRPDGGQQGRERSDHAAREAIKRQQATSTYTTGSGF